MCDVGLVRRCQISSKKTTRLTQKGLFSVLLFGSVARGEAGEGSDIDLLVVAKNFGTSGSRFEVFNKIEGELRKQ